MLYDAFDKFLSVDTWHTRHPNDEERFFLALEKVINDPQFNADKLGEYIRGKKAVSRDDERKADFNFAIDHYVAAAWAVKDYLKANGVNSSAEQLRFLYDHQAEVLSRARSALMLPHTAGAEDALQEAFRECNLAFHKMDESGLDDGGRALVAKIKYLMYPGGVVDGWMDRALILSTDQQLDFSRAVDELANWFNRKCDEFYRE